MDHLSFNTCLLTSIGMTNEESRSVMAKVLFIFYLFIIVLPLTDRHTDRPRKNYIDAREFHSGGGILKSGSHKSPCVQKGKTLDFSSFIIYVPLWC